MASSYGVVSVGQSSLAAQTGYQSNNAVAILGYGVKKNINLAFEGGYAYLGQKTVTPIGAQAEAGSAGALYGVTVFILPIEQYVEADFPLELFARVGAAYTRTAGNIAGAGKTSVATSLSPTGGVGAQYAISDNLGVKLQWDRYKFNANTGYPFTSEAVSTIGLVMKF